MEKISHIGKTIVIRNRTAELWVGVVAVGLLGLLVCFIIAQSEKVGTWGAAEGVLVAVLVIGAVLFCIMTGRRIVISEEGVDFHCKFLGMKAFRKHLDAGKYSLESVMRTSVHGGRYEDVYIRTGQGSMRLFSVLVLQSNVDKAEEMKKEIEDGMADLGWQKSSKDKFN